MLGLGNKIKHHSIFDQKGLTLISILQQHYREDYLSV